MPILFKSTRLAKMLNIPYFPITANMLMFGPAGLVGVLPREVQDPRAAARALRRPAQPGALLAQPCDGGVGAHPAHGARSALRHAAQAPQRLVRLRTTRMRVLVTGLSTYWGGRVAQALEQRPDVEVIVGLDSRDPACPARTHRVRARRLVVLDPRPHRAGDRDRHGGPLAPDRRLDARDRPHAARDQRHRHDEPARGGRRAGQPGAQGRREELGARVRRELPGSRTCSARTCTRTRAARAPAVERSLLEVEAFLRDFAEDNPHVTVTLLRFANVLGNDHRHRRSRTRCDAGRRPRSSASIRACSSCTKTTSSARSCTRPRTTSPASTTSRATATCRGARCARSSAAAALALPPVLTAWAAEPMRLLGRWDLPPRSADVAALRPHDRQQPLQARRLHVRAHERRHRRSVRAGTAARGRGRRHEPDIRVPARRRDLLPALVRSGTSDRSAADGTRSGRRGRRRRGRHARRPRSAATR